MKSFFSHLCAILFVSLLISCSTEEVNPEPEPEVIAPVLAGDTYKYIALRNDGQLFEIGNVTGKVSTGLKIPGIEFNTVFNGITSSGTKIFIYEHELDPFRGYLHVYDKATKKSQAKALNIPEEIFGTYAGLVSLEWNEAEKSLIAIIKEDFESPVNHTARVARIDPVTFEITSLNIEIEKAHILSTVYLGQVLYATSYRTTSGSGQTDFFAIDLPAGTTTSLEFLGMELPPIHLSKNTTDNTLFGFLPVPNSGFGGAAQPVLLDLNTFQITRLTSDKVIGTKNNTGNSFYNYETQDHVEIISSPTYNALLLYNMETGKVTITELEEPNELSSLIGIVDAARVR